MRRVTTARGWRSHRVATALVTLIVVALLGGCSPWLVGRSLTTNTPCAPPCWQGITPNVTSQEEAIGIVNSLSFVDAASMKKESSRAFWHLEAPWGGSLSMRFAKGRALSVSVSFRHTPISFGDVLHAQGEPETFYAFCQPDGMAAWVFHYPDKGLYIEALGGGGCSQATISKSLRVVAMTYFPPMSMVRFQTEIAGFSEEAAVEANARRCPWPGLGTKVKPGP